MDRTDALLILTALALLAVFVNVFGYAATFIISSCWFAWVLVVGTVANASKRAE